jgi:YVTN family beta-propeller protein
MRPTLPILRVLVALAVPLGFAACVAALSRSRPAAPAAAGPFLWVSNEGSNDLVLVDAGRGEVVARVPVGRRPRGLRLDAARGILYAAVSGTPRPRPDVAPAAADAPDRAADGIAAVDLTSRRVVSILPSGPDPESFDLVPGGLLVVSNEESAEATFVDATQARLVGSVAVGEEPEGVAASPDGALVAITSEGASRVDLVDPVARRVVARVPTCRRPRTVLFTPDGALAFASCELGGAVAVLDVTARRPLEEIALPEGSRPMGLALDRAGRRLYVSNGRAGTVSLVDVAARKVVATSVPFGERIWGIALGPDRRVYAADGPADALVVLDADTLAVLRRIPVGELPWGVAVVP